MFEKIIDNCIDVAEAAGALHTDPQIKNKVLVLSKSACYSW